MSRTGKPTRDTRNRPELIKAGISAAGAVIVGGHLGVRVVQAHDVPRMGGRSMMDTQVIIGPNASILDLEPEPGPVIVFVTRTIITMNPGNPETTHIAVRDGRILGAGSLHEVAR